MPDSPANTGPAATPISFPSPHRITSRSGRLALLMIAAYIASISCGCRETESVTIGSKRFTESYVLAEIAKLLVTTSGRDCTHKQGLGGTIIVWEALRSGQIDLYPEYTGTLREVILKVNTDVSEDSLRSLLRWHGIGMTGRIGFNNTYAFVVPRKVAEALGLRRISDLSHHPDLRLGFSHEFLNRNDGWESLRDRYGLQMARVRGLEHSLAYAALNSGEIDLMDAYSTDAKLAVYDLQVLKDDLGFFPAYDALFLYRLSLDADLISRLRTLEGTIDEARMIELNAEAERTDDFAFAAARFFGDGDVERSGTELSSDAFMILRLTLEHLELVCISLLLAVLVGVPLGIRASREGVLSQIILGTSGVLQTIPSLALLALFAAIPALGIGFVSAVAALFLYSLLPIVRNTAAGLQNIGKGIRESAIAIGLEPRAQLIKVYLPMASRTILAGVKTSAVINVGTATLAALIGAGGLGEPIISGLTLNDSGTILMGAIPAAILAILVQYSFDLLDRVLIPKGLRLKAETQ